MISAQFLTLIAPRKSINNSTFISSVAVDLYDLPLDTLRKKYVTTEIGSEGWNTIYPKNKFVFEKVK